MNRREPTSVWRRACTVRNRPSRHGEVRQHDVSTCRGPGTSSALPALRAPRSCGRAGGWRGGGRPDRRRPRAPGSAVAARRVPPVASLGTAATAGLASSVEARRDRATVAHAREPATGAGGRDPEQRPQPTQERATIEEACELVAVMAAVSASASSVVSVSTMPPGRARGALIPGELLGRHRTRRGPAAASWSRPAEGRGRRCRGAPAGPSRWKTGRRLGVIDVEGLLLAGAERGAAGDSVLGQQLAVGMRVDGGECQGADLGQQPADVGLLRTAVPHVRGEGLGRDGPRERASPVVVVVEPWARVATTARDEGEREREVPHGPPAQPHESVLHGGAGLDPAAVRGVGELEDARGERRIREDLAISSAL